MQPSRERIRIGRIARAHGVRGELEVRLDWSDSQSLIQSSRVALELPSGESITHQVAGARRTLKGVLLRLAEISDRSAAEAVCGATVSVARTDLPELAEGEYYLCDLVGLLVSSPEGPVGTVLEIQMYPSVDTMVIETPTGERLEQPVLDEWIGRVDLASGTVHLASRAGLIDVSPPPSRRTAAKPKRTYRKG